MAIKRDFSLSDYKRELSFLRDHDVIEDIFYETEHYPRAKKIMLFDLIRVNPSKYVAIAGGYCE